MARVCARRAAGILATAYLLARNIEPGARSSHEHLLYLQTSNLLPPETKKALEHFTRSLEKDDPQSESSWPSEIDLLAEAHWLAGALNPEQ